MLPPIMFIDVANRITPSDTAAVASLLKLVTLSAASRYWAAASDSTDSVSVRPHM